MFAIAWVWKQTATVFQGRSIYLLKFYDGCEGRLLWERKSKQDFSTRSLFLPGTLKKVPAVSVRYWYWSFFERNLVGLADFAASNFQRMVHWPRFDLKSNWGSWPSVVISSLHNRPIPLEPSRKLTNSSLRQQGIFFNVRGRKILWRFWKTMLRFPIP